MFFSRAVLEFLITTDKQPDVLHLHDWQSAAVVGAADTLPDQPCMFLPRLNTPAVSLLTWVNAHTAASK